MPTHYYRPSAPPGACLWTFGDFIDHVTWFAGGGAAGKANYLVRQSVDAAYRELVSLRDWKYFQSEGRIITAAPFSAGTIEYTAATRTVDLSDATFPAWSGNGRLRIGSAIYEVDSAPDSTTLILTHAMSPPEDLPAGTAYTLFQDVFPLPANLRNLRDGVTVDSYPLQYLTPQEWLRLTRTNSTTGQPTRYTLWSAHNRYGAVSLALYPTPDSERTIDFVFQRSPRPIRYTGYGAAETTGTIANTGAAVTGTGTAFTPAMVGSVIRFGTATNLPSGLSGVNPYSEQQIIVDVASATALTLDAAPAGTHSGVKFQISDPIDLPEYMHAAMLRSCERQASIVLKLPQREANERAWGHALEMAMASDNMAVGDSASGGIPYARDWIDGPSIREDF